MDAISAPLLVRREYINGLALDLYRNPARLGRPWPDAECLFDVIGLPPERRAAVSELYALSGPAAVALVRVDDRTIFTLSPGAATTAVDLARHSALISASTAAALHAALAPG